MKIKKKKKIQPSLPLGKATKKPPGHADDPLARASNYLSRERMLFQHEVEDLLRWGTVDSMDRAAQLIRSMTDILAAQPRRSTQEGSHGRVKTRR